MRIPKSFQLMGRTYKVKMVDNLNQTDDCWGKHLDDQNLILLQTPIKGQYAEDYIEQVFWHELTHALFDALHKPKLSKNETLVDNMGSLLHQFSQTVKY